MIPSYKFNIDDIVELKCSGTKHITGKIVDRKKRKNYSLKSDVIASDDINVYQLKLFDRNRVDGKFFWYFETDLKHYQGNKLKFNKRND